MSFSASDELPTATGLFDLIAEKNSITVTKEELTNGILEYASQYQGQEKQIFEFFNNNPAKLESIRAPIFENKVLESVLKEITRENITITINEFKKLQKTTFSFKENI